MFPSAASIHTRFELWEKTENLLLTDKLEIHFLELGKISDSKDPIDMTPLEQFCAYLKFAGDSKREDYVEKLLNTGEEAILMSEQVFRKITEDESLQDLLRRQEIAEHDFATEMMLAKREGKQQGIEQGIAAFVRDYVEDGRTPKVIIEKLQLRFGLDEEKARQYYDEYSRC